MKKTQARTVETKDLDELKWYKKHQGSKIKHIQSHDPNSPFVRVAIQFADFNQSMTMSGLWPDSFGSTLRDRFATVQALFDSQELVEAVSFDWGGTSRMRLRFHHEPASNIAGEFALEFHIRDLVAVKTMADDIVAISKAAKAPKATHGQSSRL